MKRGLWTVALAAVIAGARLSAHHSYAAYDTTQLVDYPGVLEELKVMSPHSLFKVRGDNGALYTGEGPAVPGLQRWGIDADTFKTGERIVLKGNPRRDFSESGILNLKQVQRPSDGSTWGNVSTTAPPAGSNR
jgi:hypothetical protein